jgi:transposase
MGRKKDFNTKYSPEFKLSVIMDMRKNHLGYREVTRKYWGTKTERETSKFINCVIRWERRYLEEGAAGLYVERRGRTTKMDNPKKGRPRKKQLDKKIENDLIAENQQLKERLEYLEMENEYLKKLDALVRAEAQQNGKKRK